MRYQDLKKKKQTNGFRALDIYNDKIASNFMLHIVIDRLVDNVTFTLHIETFKHFRTLTLPKATGKILDP